MCHQSVGLIARNLEAAGIATLCLTSAYSITAAVKPPRSVFIDFPLGHTAGMPHDTGGNRRLVASALAAFDTIKTPGEIVDLGLSWHRDTNWKTKLQAAASSDERTERSAIPRYQTNEDQQLAKIPCDSCIWLS